MELGKSSGDAKRKAIRGNPEMQNTDALGDGGSASSSVEAPVMGVEPRGRHSKTGGHYGQLRNQEEPPLSPERGPFAKRLSDRYEAPYEARVSRTVL
jgi:hypothetical protein